MTFFCPIFTKKNSEEEKTFDKKKKSEKRSSSANEDVDASGEIIGGPDAVDGVVEVVQREVRETLETLGERQRVGCVAAQSLHREWRSDENDGRFVVHSTRGVVDGTDVRKSGV